MKYPKLLLALAVSAIPFVAYSLPPTVYTSMPAEAWVVDAATGKPIQGAVVLAHWEMSIDGQIEFGNNYSPKIIETITDQDGHFSIQGWGPEPVCCGYMTWKDPQIFIFKPGYAGLVESDSPSAVATDSKSRDHYWNGNKLAMNPFHADLQGYEGKGDFDDFKRFSDGGVMFGFLTVRPDRCDWKKAPLLLNAFLLQISEFQQHGYRDTDSIVKDLAERDGYYKQKTSCGSTIDFLQELKK